MVVDQCGVFIRKKHSIPDAEEPVDSVVGECIDVAKVDAQ